MRRPPPKQQPMTNFLLKAIRADGRSPYRLAKEVGVKEPPLVWGGTHRTSPLP